MRVQLSPAEYAQVRARGHVDVPLHDIELTTDEEGTSITLHREVRLVEALGCMVATPGGRGVRVWLGGGPL